MLTKVNNSFWIVITHLTQLIQIIQIIQIHQWPLIFSAHRIAETSNHPGMRESILMSMWNRNVFLYLRIQKAKAKQLIVIFYVLLRRPWGKKDSYLNMRFIAIVHQRHQNTLIFILSYSDRACFLLYRRSKTSMSSALFFWLDILFK